MKKITIAAGAIVAAAIALSVPTRINVAAKAENEVEIACKSAYTCDFESGTPVYAKNEEVRLPIASMCKIMTLLLSFEAEEQGVIAYDELITVSEKAAGMGGSQVFLQENLQYSAEDLMKTVAVCSANDSCVALAERISGSETAFVEQMNERARELGAENTLFANCTGLPKEPQYSCAKDVSLMLRALLHHEKYYEFSKVWLEDFAHPDGRTTTITNTNKLVRFYEGCDGGKTGFTQQAGFCLAATAKRGDMRLVSVVIGAENSAKRFASVKNLLNFAFNGYESRKILYKGQAIESLTAQVAGGKVKTVAVCPSEDISLFQKRGEKAEIVVDYQLLKNIPAPVRKGDKVGEVLLFQNGTEIRRCDLLAAEDVDRSSWWDSFREGAELWN